MYREDKVPLLGEVMGLHWLLLMSRGESIRAEGPPDISRAQAQATAEKLPHQPGKTENILWHHQLKSGGAEGVRGVQL